MIQFTSRREKKFWVAAAFVIIAIFATLGLAQQLAGYLRDQGIITNAFWVAIYLTAGTVVWYGLKKRISNLEIGIWLGIAAVYLLVFLRMNSPEERSHLIEYSVLAIFIHEALKERARNGGNVSRPGLLAFTITALIGIVDECVQLLIPQRVFDPIDIFFNSLAAFLSVSASSALSWARNKVSTLSNKSGKS